MHIVSASNIRRAKRRRGTVLARLRPGTVRMLAFLLPVAAAWLCADTYFSDLQARLFSTVAAHLSFRVEAGTSERLWLPHSGPYDIRLGYSQMKETLPRLISSGYAIDAQSRQSDLFRALAHAGLYPIYREKAQAGLVILDRSAKPLYVGRHPERRYPEFNSAAAGADAICASRRGCAEQRALYRNAILSRAECPEVTALNWVSSIDLRLCKRIRD